MSDVIQIKRGELTILDLTLLEEGVPIDLTGYEVTFYLKDDPSKPVSQSVVTKRNDLAGGSALEITVVDAINGEIKVFLLPEDTQNLNGNLFAYTVFVKNPPDQQYPFLNSPLIVTDDFIYEYKGWSVNKRNIAYYAFQNSELFAQVPDFICERGVDLMCSELNKYKSNACASVDKTNTTLNMAIEYYAVCEMKHAGQTTTTSGNVTRESIGDKSVQYGAVKQSNTSKVPMPSDPCEKAAWLVKQYAIEKKWASKDVQYAIKNYRSELFEGTYNKYTGNYKHGVP